MTMAIRSTPNSLLSEGVPLRVKESKTTQIAKKIIKGIFTPANYLPDYLDRKVGSEEIKTRFTNAIFPRTGGAFKKERRPLTRVSNFGIGVGESIMKLTALAARVLGLTAPITPVLATAAGGVGLVIFMFLLHSLLPVVGISGGLLVVLFLITAAGMLKVNKLVKKMKEVDSHYGPANLITLKGKVGNIHEVYAPGARDYFRSAPITVGGKSLPCQIAGEEITEIEKKVYAQEVLQEILNLCNDFDEFKKIGGIFDQRLEKDVQRNYMEPEILSRKNKEIFPKGNPKKLAVLFGKAKAVNGDEIHQTSYSIERNGKDLMLTCTVEATYKTYLVSGRKSRDTIPEFDQPLSLKAEVVHNMTQNSTSFTIKEVIDTGSGSGTPGDSSGSISPYQSEEGNSGSESDL